MTSTYSMAEGLNLIDCLFFIEMVLKHKMLFIRCLQDTLPKANCKLYSMRKEMLNLQNDA